MVWCSHLLKNFPQLAVIHTARLVVCSIKGKMNMDKEVNQEVFMRETKYCMTYGFADISKIECNRVECVVECRKNKIYYLINALNV